MGIILSRHWGRDPWWFESLDRGTKIALIADWQIENEDPKKKKNTEKTRMMERIRKRREEIKSQGAKDGHENHE